MTGVDPNDTVTVGSAERRGSGITASAREVIRSTLKFGGREGDDINSFLGRAKSVATMCNIEDDLHGEMLIMMLEGRALEFVLERLGGVRANADQIGDLLKSRYTMPNDQMYLRQTLLRMKQTSSVICRSISTSRQSTVQFN
jgi:hypothetical protein